MFICKLSCHCGFKSEYFGWGFADDPSGFDIPVFVEGDPIVKAYFVEQKEREDEPEFHERVKRIYERGLVEEYGPNSHLLVPEQDRRKTAVVCPSCGGKTAYLYPLAMR